MLEAIRFTQDLKICHLRAARAILKLTLKELSTLTGININTIKKMEEGNDITCPPKSKLTSIQPVKMFYEDNGIKFYKGNIIQFCSKNDEIAY
jgi:predicted transcriptional regulator